MNFNKKHIIGMIHMSGSHKTVRAKRELDIYQQQGLTGAILENYHGSIGDIIDLLETINLNDYPDLKIGINVLPNEYVLAFELASYYNLDFIQLDHVSGNYKRTTYIDNNDYLNVRNRYSDTSVLGGVWPKYYEPIKDSMLSEDLTVARSRSEAIVVTGKGTGKETPLDKIKLFRNELGDFPLIVGAGVTPSNVEETLKHSDGIIVGTCFKPYNRTLEFVKESYVKELMERIK